MPTARPQISQSRQASVSSARRKNSNASDQQNKSKESVVIAQE